MTGMLESRSRDQGLIQLDMLMRELDRALDRRDQRAFHWLCLKRRALLRWLAR